MQPVAVKAGQLILPEGLPLGEHELLELAVGADQHQSGARLEADPPLDTQGGLSHVNTVSDSVGRCQIAELADQLRARERPAVQFDREPQFPPQNDLARRRDLCWSLQQLAGRTLPRVMGPSSAPGCPPQPPIDRVRARLARNRQAPSRQEGEGLLPLNAFVADRREDLDGWGKYPESDIEADLIVARTSRPMGHRPSSNPIRDFDQRQ